MRRPLLLLASVAALIGAGAWLMHGDGGPPPSTPGVHAVTFAGADGNTLHGELTIPRRVHGAVVLLAGFGPQDRDGSGVYRDWAQELVRRDIAVLRFDKRGIGDSDGRPLDWLDPRILADDATAAVRWLQGAEEFDRVALLGHSQGGDIALSSGARSGADRVVTIAAPARPLTRLGRRADLVVDAAGVDVADAIMRADPERDARALGAPLLIVHGRNDAVVPPGDALRLRRARGDDQATSVLWLPAAGHTPLPNARQWDRIARFVRGV